MASFATDTAKAALLYTLPWFTHRPLHHRLVETGDRSAASTTEYAEVQRLVFTRSWPLPVGRYHDHSLPDVSEHLEGDQTSDTMAATRREPVVPSPSRIQHAPLDDRARFGSLRELLQRGA